MSEANEKVVGRFSRELWNRWDPRAPERAARRAWRKVAQRGPTPVPSWEVGYASRSPLLWRIAVTSVPYLFRS